ncbi:MAG: response regulator [Candidatus Promineifilaceae bacterium]
MTDILVIDDDAFARSGVRSYLEAMHYRVREAGDVQTAWQLVLDSPPQTAIVDIRLPLYADHRNSSPPTEPHGIALAQKLKQSYPTMGIILLSAHEKYEQEVIQLAQQYVRGIAFLHKGGDMSRLEITLEEVQAGRTIFQSEIANRYILETAVRSHLSAGETYWIDQALAELDTLSPREKEIAYLLAAAYTPAAIAERTNLTKGSVDNIISRVYLKLGLAEMKQEAPDLRPLPIITIACLLHDIREQ